MKKLLIMTLILLVIVLVVYTAVEGFSIGNINVLSLKGIKEKNDELDAKISEATRLAQVDFINRKNETSVSSKQLEEAKTTYEDMVTVSSSEDVALASQIVGYKVEYLWATIGTHATREGVVIKLDIVNGSGGDKIYNLKFTVTGSYVGITDFITDIEDDSNLGFKIEEFTMKPATQVITDEAEEKSKEDTEEKTEQKNEEVILNATFTCKNVKIEDVSQTTQTQTENKQEQNDDEQNDDEQNTTNGTTDTTSETNTTNTTNTTSESNTTNTTNTTDTASNTNT